jgi:hypothetical protein
MARLPELDQNDRGLWIVLASNAPVRCGVSTSSYKLGIRKKGEIFQVEGSLNIGGMWLKLAAGQYLLASQEPDVAAVRLPDLNRSSAGKWVVACPSPSISHFSFRSDALVRCGPSAGCEQMGERRLGDIVHAEGSLDFDGGWLKLAAASDRYMRMADGDRPLVSRLPDLDASDAGAWCVVAAASQRARDGPSAECRALDAYRRGETARAAGSVRFIGGTWLQLAAAPEQYVLAADPTGGGELWARLPPLAAAAAGEWVVSSPAPQPVWLGLGGESRRAGIRRQGEAVRAEGSVAAPGGGTWLRLDGEERYMLAADAGGAQYLTRRAAE